MEAVGGTSSIMPASLAAGSHGTSELSGSRQAVARRVATTYTTAPLAEPPEDLMTIKQRPFVPSAANMEYAIVEYSGRQHMITEGSMYETYFIRAVAGSKVRLNRIFLLKRRNEDGEFEVTLGQPIIPGAYVEITILEHFKSDDQEIVKFKRKKHYLKRWIVFQKLTRFRVDRIVWESTDAPVEGKPRYPLMDEIPFESE
jgi:large subunit ribosomal protein L21